MIELNQREAVLLLPGVVMTLSRSMGIRTLIIKGRSLSDQGLRAERQSGDVDAWADPAEFDTLASALARRGWVDRDEKALAALTVRTSMFAVHSLTLMHPEWPISLDLHRCYPGFFASPQLLFDEVWAKRQFTVIGNQQCVVPNRIDHWLLAMLHVTRDGNHRELSQLRDAADRFDPNDLANLQERASKLGAVEPLRKELESLGLIFARPTKEDVRLLTEWELVISDKAHGDLSHLNEILRSRGYERLAMIKKALVPPETTYRLFHDVKPGRWGFIRALGRRWVAGILASPRMVRYVVSSIRAQRKAEDAG